MSNNLLSKLNKEQYIVASSLDGAHLILAGAGTGKTTTIVHRTAQIIHKDKCLPENILILTFTNKAAREMHERGLKLLKDNNFILNSTPNFTTFHSWGLNFIKSMDSSILEDVGIKHNFSILGESDQVAILNKCFAKFLSENDYKLNKAKNFILALSNIQNTMTPYDTIDNAYNFLIKENSQENKEGILYESLYSNFTFTNDNFDFLYLIANIFVHYKKMIRLSNSIDFDDLINLPIQILSKYEFIRDSIKNYYKYIMVDEFQDTNGSQLELINLILNDQCNICVVGDDSQAIYGWRGAKIEYILNFHKYYKNVKKFNLTINYRSDIDIIHTANTLLTHASEKHEFKKPLLPFSNNKGIIRCKFFKTAVEEAKNIANIINQIKNKTNTINGEICILYRSAFINRKIESELIVNNIKYKIHNGKALLERKISLNILSYIKYLYNQDNEIALSHALESASILSDKRIGQFQVEAENNGETFAEYIKSEDFNIKGVGSKLKAKVSEFNKEVAHFKTYNFTNKKDYSTFVNEFFSDNIISNELKAKIFNKANISEDAYALALKDLSILDIIKELMHKYNSLEIFFNDISIEGEVEDKEESKVNLMTIHASKGLEFDYVFIPGFCQGILPSAKNLNIEEERRLAFVAITRARKGLFVSGAAKYFGSEAIDYSLSQFLIESEILPNPNLN